MDILEKIIAKLIFLVGLSGYLGYKSFAAFSNGEVIPGYIFGGLSVLSLMLLVGLLIKDINDK